MTAFNAQPYARFLAATAPNLAINSSASSDRGRVHAYTGSLAATHGYTIAQDDTINFVTLPKGFRPFLVVATNGAFGSSVTLALAANDGSARSLLAATSVATAGTIVAAAAYTTPLATDAVLVGTLGGANPADNVGLSVTVFGTFE